MILNVITYKIKHLKHFSTILISFLIICTNASSQVNTTIKLNKTLDPSKVMIYFSDGERAKFFKPKVLNNKIIIKEPLQSMYVRLGIFYPNKFGNLQGRLFLVNSKKAILEINEVPKNVVDKVSNFKAENLIDVRKTKIYDDLNKYAAQELKNFNSISLIYNKKQSSENVNLYNKSCEVLKLKELEYIKLHADNYFYFEKFTQEIVPALMDNYLLKIYEDLNTVFPAKFKESYEGRSVKTLLEGTLNIKVGMQCPLFNTTDYAGNEISSDSLKGKYYLLSFWATWCGPCLKEIPQLKSIRKSYSKDKLAIISINRDTDSTKFIKGINDYEMNWTHVFNKPVMENLFGRKPIPSVYLIDQNGKIIFSSWELNLMELDGILKNELNK